MRSFMIACVIAMALSSASLPAARTHETSQQQVQALMHAWAAARVKGDVAFLEHFYAQEMRIQGTDGSVIARADDIALFASGRIKPTYIRDEDMSATVYGNVAIVTGVERLGGTYKGVAGEGAVRFTRVLVQRDGRWQLLLSQGTWIKLPTQTPR